MNELSPEQRRIRGTKARRSRRKAPVSTPGRPVMPQNLSVPARKVWKSTLKLLEDRRTLTPGDGPLLAVYAEMMVRYQQACESLATGGVMQRVTVLDSHGKRVTRLKPNPMLKVVEACETALRSYLRDFGLTALTRDRVKPLAEEKKDSGEKYLADTLRLWRLEEEDDARKRKPIVN